METFKLRILHISDLHEQGPRETSRFRRRRVLGEAWKQNLDLLLAVGDFHLVCFTGDTVWSGREDEYTWASSFIEEFLRFTGLSKETLFLVPGNHDIDRSLGSEAWEALRRNHHQVRPLALSQWLAGGSPPLGFQPGQREQLLLRQSAYRQWLSALGREELLPEHSPHGLLGYRRTLRLPRRPFDISIIGLDSSWAAGGDDDSGKLLLTDEQVGRLTTTDKGEPLAGFRLALLHHPLSDLADRSLVEPLLASHVDLLLRGHMHEPRIDILLDPDQRSYQLAAGSLYESDHLPNGFNVIEAELDNEGQPRSYAIRFRSWSLKGFWHDDNGVYREARNGRVSLPVTPRQRSPRGGPPQAPSGESVSSSVARLFRGTDNLYLSPEWIRTLHGSIKHAGLATMERRNVLLSGLPQGMVDPQPLDPDPAVQILKDLHALNLRTPSEAAEPPLLTWLQHARLLSEGSPQAEVFGRAIRALKGELPFVTITYVTSSGIPMSQNLYDSDTVVLGRVPSKAQIVFPDKGAVSSAHAELQLIKERLLVKDLGSRNHVYVNGRQEIAAFLSVGDRIQLSRNGPEIRVHWMHPTPPGSIPLYPPLLFAISYVTNAAEVFRGLISSDCVVLGRDPGKAQIVFPQETVSGAHARLLAEHHALVVEDLESAHHVYVNGQQVTSAVLTGGDRVRLSLNGPEIRVL